MEASEEEISTHRTPDENTEAQRTEEKAEKAVRFEMTDNI